MGSKGNPRIGSQRLIESATPISRKKELTIRSIRSREVSNDNTKTWWSIL